MAIFSGLFTGFGLLDELRAGVIESARESPRPIGWRSCWGERYATSYPFSSSRSSSSWSRSRSVCAHICSSLLLGFLLLGLLILMASSISYGVSLVLKSEAGAGARDEHGGDAVGHAVRGDAADDLRTGWLLAIAAFNPFAWAVDGIRALFDGQPGRLPRSGRRSDSSRCSPRSTIAWASRVFTKAIRYASHGRVRADITGPLPHDAADPPVRGAGDGAGCVRRDRGGIHPYIGQEAVAAGVWAALRPDDLIFSNHRGHGHVLAKGSDPGAVHGRAGRSDHRRRPGAAAARCTRRLQRRRARRHRHRRPRRRARDRRGLGARPTTASDRVVVSFFGDGAVNQGALLEAFNLASLWRVPVVFVCENNGYATTPAGARPRWPDRSPAAARRSASPSPPSTEWTPRWCSPPPPRRSPGPGRGRARRCSSSSPTASTPTTRSSTRPGCATATRRGVERWRARDPLALQASRVAEGVPGDRRRRDRDAAGRGGPLRRRTARAPTPPTPWTTSTPPACGRGPECPPERLADAQAVLPQGAQPGADGRDGARPRRVRARRGRQPGSHQRHRRACSTGSAPSGSSTRRCPSRASPTSPPGRRWPACVRWSSSRSRRCCCSSSSRSPTRRTSSR